MRNSAAAQAATAAAAIAPVLRPRLRLLVWPVDGNVWLLHAVAPRAEVTGQVTVVSQLRDRATSWALKQWREVEQAESGMKLYLKRSVAALLRFVSDEEVSLRAIPADSRACVVLHPPAADGSAVAAHLVQLAKERRQFHRKWYGASIMALGITVPLMVIPIVPALPAYWNVFRIWSNRRAWLGAAALDELLASCSIAAPLKPCTRTLACSAGECCRVAAAVDAASDASSVLVPCDLLAAAHSAADEANLARVAADAERALDAPGLAAHAHERLLAAQKLRREHGQL